MDDLENNDIQTETTDPLKKPLKDEGNSASVSLDVPFTPYNHTTVDVPQDEPLSAFGSKPELPPQEQVGYFEGVKAQIQDKHISYQLAHGSWENTEDYLDGYKDPNFNPLNFTDKFLNVNLEYQPYLLASENEKQMNFRLQRIYQEQSIDEKVKNGSWMQWLTGEAVSLIDPINLIPVIGEIKYSSFGKTFVRNMLRKAPGGIAYGLAEAGGKNLDKVNGNLHDFMVDGLINSVFATSLFALPSVGSLAADKLALWDLRSYMTDAVNGIGYKLKVGTDGKVEGMLAYDMTGKEGMNAMKVKLAQDKADSTFNKSGFFKIPYIGTAAEKFMSNSLFGSTTLSALTSPYQTLRMIYDNAYDHGIVTTGLSQGLEKPVPFFTRIQQTHALIRQEQNIFNALHMERNGIDSKNYVAQNLKQGGLYARQKSLEMIKSEIGDRPYISVEEFSQEVEQVMHSGESHSEGSVNAAAGMFKKSMDEYYKAFRIAHNLPEDWLPPRTAKEYLMRVYDTNFMNNNLDSWVSAISNELRKQDNKILERLEPISTLEQQIKDFTEQHTSAVRELGTIAEQEADTTELVSNKYKTYYRGENKPVQYQNKMIDTEFGKGNWYAEHPEHAAHYGKNIKQITGDYKIYDINNGNNKIINDAHSEFTKLRNKFREENLKNGLDYYTDEQLEQLKLLREKFLNEVKKQGYEGLKRLEGLGDKYGKRTPVKGLDGPKPEIMFFEPTKSNIPQKDMIGIQLRQLKAKLKAMKEQLQDEIRSNPDLHILADDWNDLSSKESKELTGLLKPQKDIEKAIEDQKKVVAKLKAEKSRQLSAAKKSETVEKAKPKAEKFVSAEDKIADEEVKLNDLKEDLIREQTDLEVKAHKGEINSRFFKTENERIIFKNPEEKLKLRKTYHEQPGYRISESEAHEARKEHAKAYFDTIMNQTAEDTINQIMGKFTGNGFENHIKSRTLMVPDQVLYDNHFMSKDLLSKVANYKLWMARRTALKNTYVNSSLEGGFEPLIKQLHDEFDRRRSAIHEAKTKVEDKLSDKNITLEERKKLNKSLKQVEKDIKKETKTFNRAKNQAQFAYEKMMGISKLDKRAKGMVSGIKAFNVFANLGFLPATMITDLSANPLKQGFLPFIVDGLYPTITSLGGLIKTHDSESLRATAGALNLALHHIGNSTASRQIDLSTSPYLNLGRIPEALDKVAHFTSNINLTTTIDNYLQRVTSAVAQSNVIRHMLEFEKGTLSKGDRMWLNRYGLNPEKDSEAILKAYRKDGGGTNKLGGYQSNFYHWEDLPTANKVSDAVFRSTHDTIISANALDAPIWLDENGLINFMAPIIRGFKGWAFASLNRYLIPTLQEPDAQKMMSFALMSASAALVSPSRRMARGDSPYRDDQSTADIIGEILLDSPQFAWLSESLNDMNLLTAGTLLGNIKNDKYYDRTIMGIMGPTGSNANKLYNFVNAMGTGNMNQKDVMGMASMIPVANSLYGYQLTRNFIDNFGLPKYRSR